MSLVLLGQQHHRFIECMKLLDFVLDRRNMLLGEMTDWDVDVALEVILWNACYFPAGLAHVDKFLSKGWIGVSPNEQHSFTSRQDLLVDEATGFIPSRSHELGDINQLLLGLWHTKFKWGWWLNNIKSAADKFPMLKLEAASTFTLSWLITVIGGIVVSTI